MKDVQKQIDNRNIFLNRVGIKDFRFPVEIKNKRGEWLGTAGNISLFVGLAENQKGTHMSRFLEIIQDNRKMDLKHMKKILEDIREKLESDSSYIIVDFDYFIEKESPVTKIKSMINVKVEYEGFLVGDDFEFKMKVISPATTLCPCSKEISQYSAHNQRANISIQISSKKFVWIEDIVKIAEESASAPVYSLLKRPDEKFVTEQAYDNPRFVEDVCREVKIRVDKMEDIEDYIIEVESLESIHNHSAYAMVTKS